MKSYLEFLSEATVRMEKDAIIRYAAMKQNGVPQYQFLETNGSNSVVRKGQDVDYYDESGNKQYGTVQSVNSSSGVVKIKDSKTKKSVSVQGYPKGVIG